MYVLNLLHAGLAWRVWLCECILLRVVAKERPSRPVSHRESAVEARQKGSA